MEKSAIRAAVLGAAVMLLISLASISLFAVCPYSLKCPMHSNTTCTGTGRTKYINGKQWAEYQCPGLGGDAAHTFWVQCD